MGMLSQTCNFSKAPGSRKLAYKLLSNVLTAGQVGRAINLRCPMRPEILGPNQLLRPAENILVKRGIVTVQECVPCQPCVCLPTISLEALQAVWFCVEFVLGLLALQA